MYFPAPRLESTGTSARGNTLTCVRTGRRNTHTNVLIRASRRDRRRLFTRGRTRFGHFLVTAVVVDRPVVFPINRLILNPILNTFIGEFLLLSRKVLEFPTDRITGRQTRAQGANQMPCIVRQCRRLILRDLKEVFSSSTTPTIRQATPLTTMVPFLL